MHSIPCNKCGSPMSIEGLPSLDIGFTCVSCALKDQVGYFKMEESLTGKILNLEKEVENLSEELKIIETRHKQVLDNIVRPTAHSLGTYSMERAILTNCFCNIGDITNSLNNRDISEAIMGTEDLMDNILLLQAEIILPDNSADYRIPPYYMSKRKRRQMLRTIGLGHQQFMR